MIVGIVGSEEAKFTDVGKIRAIAVIEKLIERPEVEEVVSGQCHLGGIDIWAIQIAFAHGKKITEFPPRRQSWEFYRRRNLLIAERSHEVHCITVNVLPIHFMGMTFPLCYHCGTRDHVKSGGCWTMKKAIEMGKVGELHVVSNT